MKKSIKFLTLLTAAVTLLLPGCKDPNQELPQGGLEAKITSINITNARTKVNGTTLTELIARKDVLQLKISAYRDAVHQASLSTSRARGTEIKVKPLLKAADLQKQIDLMSKELIRKQPVDHKVYVIRTG